MAPVYTQFANSVKPRYQNKLAKILKRNVEIRCTEKLTSLDQFVLDFVYNSNRSEGSRIEREDFMKIVEKKKSKYPNQNEILEIKNSFALWEFLQKKFVWNEAYIKKCYHILTKWLMQEDGTPYPKWYKKHPIIVGNSTTLEPEKVPEAMRTLLKWYKTHKKTMFPLQLAIEFHWRFERIHPFANGNGRVGRMLMNKILISHDMVPVTIFAENRRAYFNAIEKSIDGSFLPIYSFILDQYVKTLR